MEKELAPNSQSEDIFKNTYADEIILCGQADRKAGVMLLVNSFIITIISSLLILNRDLTLGIPGILILSLFTIALMLSVKGLMQGMSKPKYSLEVVIRKKNEYLRLSYIFFLAAVGVSVALFILASLSYRGVRGDGMGVE